MRENSPRRYRIEGLGEWGIAEGAVFDNWEEREFDWHEIAQRPNVVSCFGLDFGYSVDPTALSASIVDLDAKEIYIFDEHYERGMQNDKIAEMIKYKGYAKEKIIADCAEPKSIDEIRKHGIDRMRPASKGRDSVLNGIQFLQQFKIYVHPKCVNMIIELSNYVWSTDKDGALVNKPIDEYNHLVDALRYSVEPIARKNGSKLIIPGQSAQTIVPIETDDTSSVGSTTIVKSTEGSILPTPVTKRKKHKTPTCPECDKPYSMRRGNSFFCQEHGWHGSVGIPDGFIVR